MSRSSFALGWHGKTDLQMHSARSLRSKLKGRWIQLPDQLLARKWIHLVEPLLALPSTILRLKVDLFWPSDHFIKNC